MDKIIIKEIVIEKIVNKIPVEKITKEKVIVKLFGIFLIIAPFVLLTMLAKKFDIFIMYVAFIELIMIAIIAMASICIGIVMLTNHYTNKKGIKND